jgi:hypothetical protein
VIVQMNNFWPYDGMQRRKVFLELHTMVGERLFRSSLWLADMEVCSLLARRLEQLGLQERVADREGVTKDTPLGKELKIDLQMAFMGLMDEWHVPYILETHCLVDKVDADNLYFLMEMGGDAETLLRPVIQNAYFNFYNRSGLFN